MFSRHSSGNQSKYIKNGYLYKEDTSSCEGAAEYAATRLLENSNLKEFVEYELYSKGCRSKIVYPDWKQITLFSLIKNDYTRLVKMSVIDRYSEVLKIVSDTINYDASDYFSQIIQFDYSIINQDRHFRNIIFLKHDSIIKPFPVFDNGDSFLLRSLGNNLSIEFQLENAKSKPFGTSYENSCTVRDNSLIFHLILDAYFKKVFIQNWISTIKNMS